MEGRVTNNQVDPSHEELIVFSLLYLMVGLFYKQYNFFSGGRALVFAITSPLFTTPSFSASNTSFSASTPSFYII